MAGYSASILTQAPVQPKQGKRDLVQQAILGDKQAIGDLYLLHIEAIYRYVYGRVGNVTVAEDLTAQVFLNALEALPRYQQTSAPFSSWLYCIARARIADHWRLQNRRQEKPLVDTLPSTEPHPIERLAAQEDWSLALDLLAQLTESQQNLVCLRFLGELSTSEVAKALGKSVAAVKALQHRALASLARLREQQTMGFPS